MFLCVGAEIPESKREENRLEWRTFMEKMMNTNKMLDGAPFGKSKTVTNPGIAREFDWTLDSDSSGYWIMELTGMDEAVDFLTDCPQFFYGGTVEIRQLIEMS